MNTYKANPEVMGIFKEREWWKMAEEENEGVANIVPFFEGEEWVTQCYCGERMTLYFVPEHWLAYKCIRSPNCEFCNINKKLDVKKQTKNIYTYQCQCGLFHAAHQIQKSIENEMKRRPLLGKPLGIPCSALCMCFRHYTHLQIQTTSHLLGWNKEIGYKNISRILKLPKESAHVALLGISQMKLLILKLREISGDI